jgi:hypothetical protein
MPPTPSTLVPTSPVPLLLRSEIPHPERAIASGSVVRVAQAVYASAAEWQRLPSWDRYAARVHAVALTRPGSVFCHESACVALQQPVFAEPAYVHVIDGTAATSRVSAGVRTHTMSSDREIVSVGGILVTSPAETAVDIARSRHPAVALAVADAVLRADPGLTIEQLTAVNESRASSRGRRRARWVIPRADARAEKPLESISRAAIEWLGFEEPELQWELRHPDGSIDRADFRWSASGVLGEADGRIKYSGEYGDPAEVYYEEKRREDRMRRHATGYARWGWAEVSHYPELRSILIGAGLERVHPEATAQLATLRAAINGTAQRLLPRPTR